MLKFFATATGTRDIVTFSPVHSFLMLTIGRIESYGLGRVERISTYLAEPLIVLLSSDQEVVVLAASLLVAMPNAVVDACGRKFSPSAQARAGNVRPDDLTATAFSLVLFMLRNGWHVAVHVLSKLEDLDILAPTAKMS